MTALTDINLRAYTNIKHKQEVWLSLWVVEE